MSEYRPMRIYFSPASIPQIVAHIEDYLYRNPIVSTETIAEIIVQALSEHPELLNGSVIPITEESEQSIKAYIDSMTVDTYTKAQIDTLLSGKQNTLQFDNTPTAESTNPVTSDGINTALVTLESAINAVLVTKANAANVYTKAQTDTLLLDKADVSNVYSKNTIDAMFETVPTLEDVYDKSDIDYMRQIDKANTAIVTTNGIAPTNISAGQYVYVGDVLYMATQAITQGDTVVPGTNAELNPLGVTNRIGDGLQNVAGAVSSLSQQIGNVTLPTTAQTLTGAIKENNDKISGLGPVNNLTNNSTTAALSAAMGKYIYDGFGTEDYLSRLTPSANVRIDECKVIRFNKLTALILLFSTTAQLVKNSDILTGLPGSAINRKVFNVYCPTDDNIYAISLNISGLLIADQNLPANYSYRVNAFYLSN